MESSGMLVSRHFVRKFRVGRERNIDPLNMNFQVFSHFQCFVVLRCRFTILGKDSRQAW